ncbi:MAG TPA: hypothetical protein VNC78_01260 [Actinomycetota bacterium]|nr:hypothetical protein [Actinomycetota bacterium]
MPRKLRIVIPSIVLAVAAGVLVTSSASGQTVLHVVFGPQEENKTALVDVNRDGLRLGDRIAARGPLVDESQTERVGTAYLQCLVHRRIVDPDRGLWNCNYVLELADGDIVLQGLDPRGPGEYEMSVLGGTGAYASATGDATFTDGGTDGDGYTDMMIRLDG